MKLRFLQRIPGQAAARLRTLVLAAVMAGATQGLPAGAAGTAAAGVAPDAPAVARRVCLGCHGPAGHANSPLFPHLAGQPREYLAAQLRAFRSHERNDREARDYMWGIARSLDDATIDALADYYARQSPVDAPTAAVDRVAMGEDLFRHGDPQHGIPACTSCHGERGEGREVIPRIAGQQPDYVRTQMLAIQRGERPATAMKEVVGSMDERQINALADFLAAQR